MEKLNHWKYFRTFYSTNYSSNFLKQCYKNFSEAEKLSFQNSYTLIYYLEHGKKYYDQSLLAPYELQPVLLFYGMIQLFKATILTVDPHYPATTQVLAHGVSTRKRKKSQYEFLDDEVKVQKNGLLTYFSEKIFKMKQLDGEKYKMKELMKRIPELHPSFSYVLNEEVSYPIRKNANATFSVSSSLLDTLYLTADGFNNFINDHLKINVDHCREENKEIILNNFKKQSAVFSSPLQFHYEKQDFYLPASREQYSFFPELIVHYLLLYNLSMVCRYETEWWGELFHSYPSDDLPFITEFLEITKEKVPYYISLIFQQYK